ncbi:hypothetical protein GCM10027321_17010 [Massilia terrae]|uniref:Uncharacterized protein n=1 Tax=Massilia terrae TaxID=1811224 RepID=A0ABT2CW90_9BURK|nr:hypothetical protein [Massilia terrae]MCS0658230.1 hypothetical protein [Massilia terrae]
MRRFERQARCHGTLAWTRTNYVNNDPPQFLGGAPGSLQLKPYGAITPGKTGNVLAYDPAQFRPLIPGVDRVHTALRGKLKINDNTAACADLLYSYSKADETLRFHMGDTPSS